jgi:hypothetical protein
MSERQLAEDVPLRLLAQSWSDEDDLVMSREEEEGADVGLLWAADAMAVRCVVRGRASKLSGLSVVGLYVMVSDNDRCCFEIN